MSGAPEALFIVQSAEAHTVITVRVTHNRFDLQLVLDTFYEYDDLHASAGTRVVRPDPEALAFALVIV